MTLPAPLPTPWQWRFWPLQFLGWIGLALFSFPLKLFFLGTWQAALVATLIREGLSFLLTLAIRPLYRNIYRRKPIKGHLGFYALLIGGVSIAASLIDTAHISLMNISLGSPHMGQGPFIVGTFCYRVGLFCFWSILYFGIRLMQENHAREIAWRDAEIRVLRAQINPHFFFNALNTIQVQKDPASLSTLVQDLAAFLRYSLRFRSDDLVALSDEFQAAVHYLAIEKARFREGLEVSTSLDPAASGAQVPGIILQPLLENAVKYGRFTSPPPLRVELVVKCPEAGWLEASVRNTGRWLSPEEGHQKAENGVGLENLRQRLWLLYGERFSIKVEESDGSVCVSVRLPFERSH